VSDHHALLVAAKDVTRIGEPLVVDIIAAIAAVALVALRQPMFAVFVVVVRVATQLLSSGLKTAVGRHRPLVAHPVATWHGYSFPSGHAAGAASVYVPLALIVVIRLRPSRWRWVVAASAGTACLAVAASRVLLGAHYPSDVLAGLVLGTAVTAAAWAALGRFRAESATATDAARPEP
jgi:undecaprenyl-diphosphatase